MICQSNAMQKTPNLNVEFLTCLEIVSIFSFLDLCWLHTDSQCGCLLSQWSLRILWGWKYKNVNTSSFPAERFK
jgi:hypothetical protein